MVFEETEELLRSNNVLLPEYRYVTTSQTTKEERKSLSEAANEINRTWVGIHLLVAVHEEVRHRCKTLQEL